MVIESFIQAQPVVSIILLSALVSLGITIVNYYLTDKEKMKEIRTRQKELRAEMKKHKDDPEKVMEINKQLLEDFPEQMKQSMKPMLVTIIPILILFRWLSVTYAATPIASSWIWWYIGASLVSSIVFRKLFKLQ